MEIHGGPSKRKKRKPAEPEWLQFMSAADKESARVEKWQSVSLAEVGLPVRIVNTLEDQGVMTVGDLTQKTIEQLQAIPNLGDVTIAKCKKLLEDLRLPNQLKVTTDDDTERQNSGRHSDDHDGRKRLADN